MALIGIFGLLAVLGQPLLALFFQRYWVVEAARKNLERNALTFFVFSMSTLLIAVIVLFVLVLIAFAVLAMMGVFGIPFWFVMLLGPPFLMVRLHAKTGWRDRDDGALERRAVTKYQIWMQDLIVAALTLGAVLSGYAALRGPNARTDEVALMIFGEMLAIIPAFFIGLSVIRFHPDAKNPKMRAVWMVGFMLLGSIPFVSLVWMLPSWFAFLLGMSRLPEEKVVENVRAE